MAFTQITPRTSSGAAATFSTSKAGGGFALNISLPQPVNGDAAMTHAEVFIDAPQALLGIRLNDTGSGFKLNKTDKGRQRLRVPITPETHLRNAKIPVGVAAQESREDGMTVFMLPAIYWEVNE